MKKSYEGLLNVEDRSDLGEVATPQTLVDEMIAKIPEHIFESSTTTFLDPCMGNGTFIIALIRKLREYGHTIKNIESRIYGGDINLRFYNKVTKKLLRNYNFKNIYHGDSLKKKFNMKFDVVIGNPPYQSTSDGSNRKKAWVQFSEFAMNVAPIVVFVTPQAWQSTVKKYFKAIGNSIKSRLVAWGDANKHFNVGEDIGWWVTNSNLEPIKFVKDEPFVDLFNKVRRTEDMPAWHYRDFQLPWVGNKSKGEHVDLTMEPTNTHTEPVFHTSKQIRYAEKKDVKYTGLKVIVNNSGGYHDPNDLDRYNWIEGADKYVGQGMWGIKINSREEGEAVLSWVRCKLYRLLVKEMKAGGGFNNQFVELQHLGTDRIWTDEEVYSHFNLTKEEIALIEKSI